MALAAITFVTILYTDQWTLAGNVGSTKAFMAIVGNASKE